MIASEREEEDEKDTKKNGTEAGRYNFDTEHSTNGENVEFLNAC